MTKTEITSADAPVPWRVVLIDAQPMAREGWRARLAGEPDFSLCGEAGTIATAEALCAAVGPDVVVLDPEMDGGGGWRLLATLVRARPPVRCLVWLDGGRREAVRKALEARAQAVCLRTEGATELLAALREAAMAGSTVSAGAMQLLLKEVAHGGRAIAGKETPLPPGQAQVFRLLGEGLTPGRIAQRLGVSPKTVQTHVARLKKQLGVKTQAELCRDAVLAAAQAGRRRRGSDRHRAGRGAQPGRGEGEVPA